MRDIMERTGADIQFDRENGTCNISGGDTAAAAAAIRRIVDEGSDRDLRGKGSASAAPASDDLHRHTAGGVSTSAASDDDYGYLRFAAAPGTPGAVSDSNGNHRHAAGNSPPVVSQHNQHQHQYQLHSHQQQQQQVGTDRWIVLAKSSNLFLILELNGIP